MLTIVTGAPCAGKSTYCAENANGSIVVDFDKLALALGAEESHNAQGEIKQAAFTARTSVISEILEKGYSAFIIHTFPNEDQIEAYKAAGAEFVTLDPGKDECLRRAEQDKRPQASIDAIERYYSDKKGVATVQRKSFNVSVEAKDGGEVRAYASTFDRIPDAYGDVIAPNAFDETIKAWKESGKPIPLLWGHDTADPFSNIGACVDYGTDERGLWFTAEFDEDNEKAQYVRKLCNEGRVYQCSFAFNCTDAANVTLEDGSKARELRKIELYEISIVQIPANQLATIEESKDAPTDTDTDALENIAAELTAIIEEVNALIQGADDTEEEPIEPSDEPEADNTEEGTQDESAKAAILQMFKESI